MPVEQVIDQLLIALLARGHCLLVGVPGLAKTLLISSLAELLNLTFSRIQFTPDLMPSDVTGSEILEEDTSTGQRVFRFIKGPVFSNIVLADEINRTPPKTQAALLEAMQEKQVTIGNTTYKLDRPFLVMATQNPIEQEGTYPLPEAQVDRFMMKIKVDYPSAEQEKEIVKRTRSGISQNASAVVAVSALQSARETLNDIHMEDRLVDYIVRFTGATRNPAEFKLDIAPMISYGASPRASIWLEAASRAHAFLNGRGYVTPQDVKSMAPDVLRHRILLSYEAEAEGVTPDTFIRELIARIAVP